MAVDVLTCVLLVVMSGLGYRKGALAQVLNIAAVALSVAASRPTGAVLSVLIYGEVEIGEPLVDFGLVAAGGALVFVILTLVSMLIERWWRKEDDELPGFDRWAGAALGGLKALLVAYVAAAGILSIEGALVEADPDDQLAVRNSYVVELARAAPRPWEFKARARPDRES